MAEAVVLVVLAFGLALGTYYVAQSPAFWVGLVKHVAKEVAPVLTRRMSKADEEAWHDCNRRAGKWNARKRRCE